MLDKRLGAIAKIQELGKTRDRSKNMTWKWQSNSECLDSPIKKFFYLIDVDLIIAKTIICDLPRWKDIKKLSNSYFNRINFIAKKKIISHLNKYLSDDLKMQLFEIILATKNTEDILLAGSNAATILNECCFSWKNRDLKGVRIPWADFSNNLLINVDFEGSNLSEL